MRRGRVHRTSSHSDCTCACMRVPRNCGNRSIRISVGELRGCSRSQLLLQWWNTPCQSLPCLWRHFQSCSQRQHLAEHIGTVLAEPAAPAPAVCAAAPSTAYIAMLVSADGARDVVASHSVTSVLAAGTLRRHTLRLLLRQQGRCGVTFAHCCCGSRDVEASFWQTAVASAGTLPVVVTSHQLLRRSQRRACDEAPQIRRWCQRSPPFPRKLGGFRKCRVEHEVASVSERWLLGCGSLKTVATCARVANWRGRITRLRPQHPGVVDLRRARSSCCRVARR